MSMSTTVDVVPGRSLSIATNEDLATLGGEAGVLAVASSAMLAEDLSPIFDFLIPNYGPFM